MTAEEMKLSMFRTRVENRGFEFVPTHYIVGCNGDFVKVNDISRIVGATLDGEANRNSINIEIVGDFNQNQPNQSQYDMVNQLIEWILEKYPDMEIKGHGDFQAKNCPGKNFDWSKIKGNITSKYYVPEEEQEKQDKELKDEIIFSLSRYYSVMPNQKRYYNGRSYEDDFKINCAGDCLYTADGHNLIDGEWGKVVACPKEYKLGTKFYIEGIGEVICHDRGGKIITQGEKIRLDLRMGVGDSGLDRIYNNSIRGGEYKGYVIK